MIGGFAVHVYTPNRYNTITLTAASHSLPTVIDKPYKLIIEPRAFHLYRSIVSQEPSITTFSGEPSTSD